MAAEIRSARSGDAPALGRMGAALMRQHHQLDPARFMEPREAEAGYASWLGREAGNPEAVVLVASEGEAVLGYAYGRLEGVDWATFRGPAGEFLDLWVEPGGRGQGLGARLAESMVARLRAMGAPQVILQVAAPNASARRLFARLGWRETMVEMTREA